MEAVHSIHLTFGACFDVDVAVVVVAAAVAAGEEMVAVKRTDPWYFRSIPSSIENDSLPCSNSPDYHHQIQGEKSTRTLLHPLPFPKSTFFAGRHLKQTKLEHDSQANQLILFSLSSFNDKKNICNKLFF